MGFRFRRHVTIIPGVSLNISKSERGEGGRRTMLPHLRDWLLPILMTVPVIPAKPDRTPEDLLFQVLLDWGVDLSLPIRKETIHPQMTQMNAEGKAQKNNPRKSAQSADKKSYEVFFVDENALVACFDTDVNEELVKELARFRSYDMPIRKMVFRDNGFESDAVKINVEQIFKQMSPGTEVKSL